MRLARLILFLIVGLPHAPLHAQETPPRSSWIIEGGVSTIHGDGQDTEDGPGFSLVYSRHYPDEHLRGGGAIGFGTADESFVTAMAMVGWEPFGEHMLSPIADLRLGLLAEPEGGGLAASVGLGLRVKLADAIAFHAMARAGRHGDRDGPGGLYVGFEVFLR